MGRPGSQSPLYFIPKVFYRVEVRTLQPSQVHQTVPTKLGAWTCPKSLGMLKHSEFLSLELRGQAQLLKYNPKQSPLHQTLHLAQCSQTSTVLLATAKPRLIHQIAKWRRVIHHSRERVSTALESSGSVLYTTASHCSC